MRESGGPPTAALAVGITLLLLALVLGVLGLMALLVGPA